jgi:hypothetical protein
MGALVLWLAKNVLQRFWPRMDTQRAQTLVVVGLIASIAIAVLIFGWMVSGWFKTKPKMDHDTADRINSKNREEVKAEVRERVEENTDVMTTVDGRNYLNDVNAVEKNRKIDEKTNELTGRIEQVKQEKKRDLTSEEVECVLMGTC